MKNALSVIILLVVCLVMVSTVTLSYFTDISDASEIHFTTGKVEVDIDSTDGNWDDWKPGEGNAENITWEFLNSGTMVAYLKVNINTHWETDGESDHEPPTVTWTQTGDCNWEFINGFWHYPDAIAPGQKVPLSFKFYINSIKGYRGSDYKITLTVEAVQATNNASME